MLLLFYVTPISSIPVALTLILLPPTANSLTAARVPGAFRAAGIMLLLKIFLWLISTLSQGRCLIFSKILSSSVYLCIAPFARFYVCA